MRCMTVGDALDALGWEQTEATAATLMARVRALHGYVGKSGVGSNWITGGIAIIPTLVEASAVRKIAEIDAARQEPKVYQRELPL